MELVSNCLLLAAPAAPGDTLAPVHAERRQTGCVRFTYLPFASLVPRRFRCQPESAEGESDVAPRFTSLRYGVAAYCQLARSTPDEIRTGADDESEMGAFHALFPAQRETNLQVRLARIPARRVLGRHLLRDLEEACHELRLQPLQLPTREGLLRRGHAARPGPARLRLERVGGSALAPAAGRDDGSCIPPERGGAAHHAASASKSLATGGALTIGPGRIYVDGLLAENHGAAPMQWDPALAELSGTAPVSFFDQPYVPFNTTDQPAPADVFNRPALVGGPFLLSGCVAARTDPPRRSPTWSRRPSASTPRHACRRSGRSSCCKASAAPPAPRRTPTCRAGRTTIRPSGARLTNSTVPCRATSNPCLMPPRGGLQGAGEPALPGRDP